MVRVKDLMTSEPFTCGPSDLLSRAASILNENKIGCLPVVDGNCIVGIITREDVCLALAQQERRLGEIQVSDVMSETPLSTAPDETILDAGNVMKNYGIRRLPVVGKEGTLVGILSLADIAREATRQWQHGEREINHAQVGAILTALTEKRRSRAVRSVTSVTGPRERDE